MVFIIEAFDSHKHNRSEFCCGKSTLDSYIRQQASQDVKKKVATVFVLIDTPKTDILAYYALSSYTVETQSLDKSSTKHLPRYPLLPATFLSRLAVDSRHQGKRYGELILIDALRKSLNAAQQVASLAVIAEALDEQALSFYLRYGFVQFKQELMKLYLPMKSVEDLCQVFES